MERRIPMPVLIASPVLTRVEMSAVRPSVRSWEMYLMRAAFIPRSVRREAMDMGTMDIVMSP